VFARRSETATRATATAAAPPSTTATVLLRGRSVDLGFMAAIAPKCARTPCRYAPRALLRELGFSCEADHVLDRVQRYYDIHRFRVIPPDAATE
jgi:hypothetical protein